MKIAVYGASGMAGSRIVAEALNRGHEVIAITRSGKQIADTTAVASSLNNTDEIAKVTADADVVVSAIGPSRTGGDPADFINAIKAAVQALNGKRFVIVGGAGSLLVDGVKLCDTPSFPADYLSEAKAHSEVLDYLRTLGTDNWTYLSPAPIFTPGERTGKFKLGDDNLVGEQVSAEDYAIALLDEIENPKHAGRRFSVAN